MKHAPVKTILAIATLLTGCVFSAPEQQAPSLCRPSCVLLWKYVDTIPLAPGDTDRYINQVGRARLSFEGILEDGREAIFSRERFDTLKVGDTLSGCNMNPAIVCQEQP